MAGAASQQAAARPAARAGRRATREPGPVAAVLPVARVAVDIPLAHLDRPFDYLIPERLSDQAVPGCRVRVRFAGQLVDGYLLERAAVSEHQGRLARLERVVSPEPVLSPEIMALAREVADRCAGTMADVLRLAIPPRHARTEAAAPGPDPAADGRRPGGPIPDPGPATRPARRSWTPWPASAGRGPYGRRCPARAGRRRSPGRWPPSRPPGAVPWSWCPTRATSACWTRRSPRSSGRRRHVTLSADLGPAERYRRWLAIRRGGSEWWRVPGPRCSRRSATWGWWSSGTTATTCTPSRAPPTRTPVRCWRCAPTAPARPS